MGGYPICGKGVPPYSLGMEGGTPIQPWTGGPLSVHLLSSSLDGDTPSLDLVGYPPSEAGWGVAPSRWGYPYLSPHPGGGIPPSKAGWGTPVQGWGDLSCLDLAGVPPSKAGWGVHPCLDLARVPPPRLARWGRPLCTDRWMDRRVKT